MDLNVKTIKKYEGKTISKLLKIAQTHFNKYIRQRDSDGERFRCISCQQYKDISMMHAGHYMAAGIATKHRFNEHNVHGQCSACNTHLHGNLILYRKNLVRKIGEDEVIMIENTRHLRVDYTRFDLISIIEEYKAKCK